MSHEIIKLNRKYEFDNNESEIVIGFKYRAGGGGSYFDPPEPDEIEILKIETEHGNDITDLVSSVEFEAIEAYLYENWEDSSWNDHTDRLYEQDGGKV